MPTARKSPRRRRCAFSEGSQRCPAHATADSPLCRPHALAAAALAAGQTRTARVIFDRGRELLDDLLNGRRISREKIIHAANEAATVAMGEWNMGGNFPQYEPPPPAGADPGRFDPSAAGARPPPGWSRRAAPPPPPDPDAEARRAQMKARITLGFAPTDQITHDNLKARHRLLVRKHHPDHGGSTQRMQEINAARDVLEQCLPRRR